LLAAVGCFCSFFAGVMAIAEPGEDNLAMALLFFGLTLAGGGSIAMIAMRQRYKLGWPMLLVAVILWSIGAILFASGLMAALMYDEPNQFMSNLGYSVGLCIGPGGFLALIGLFLFGYEAYRETGKGEDETEPTPDDSADEWLKSVKADEKSKLDEDTF
jgi:uncharacterized membrane protein HdeD (DUF308 family)